MTISKFNINVVILNNKDSLTQNLDQMKLKTVTKTLLLALAILVVIPSFGSVDATASYASKPSGAWSEMLKGQPAYKELTPEMIQMGLEQFLSLTPSKYKELTGKKLGFKKSIELKAAQKYLKKKMAKAADIPKGLYIVLAIFGLGWLAMGLLDDWTGNDWWINLILTFLCWLPGLIHALVKMKKYYN